MFLGNALNDNKAMVVGRYVLTQGISLGRFSYATAVGLVQGVISITILLTCNALCNKFFGRGLYTGGGNQ